ncbi:imidazole glycerol phosphate synthase subunit HisF [Rubeoparvulum massiliense]|uniref:imidazole glycerol phosphate synthase subunit HisF n=1 Tax=Rubeoparvulum massiliense TaxID=1631346 RepID=UPI00065E11DC|nr:imidazole glycerol phosphate synthase subunit HisF [Rubeoparvulum massiliense]
MSNQERKRIIPCLDVKEGRVVKGKQFKRIVDVADPLQLTQEYCDAGADELVLYDITATVDNRGIFIDLVEAVAEQVTVPFTVGGGIRTLEDVQRVLNAGADKVSINSAAVKNPALISEIVNQYGSEVMVLAIDAIKDETDHWCVTINGGRFNTGKDVVEWAKEAEALGAGEIVLNVINTDGEESGYDLEITKQVADAVSIPVIASGGAGKPEDFLAVLQESKASAALAASVFHYGKIRIDKLKTYLKEQGVGVKMN